MKYLLSISFLLSFFSYSQLEGSWQGVRYSGNSIEEGTVFYLFIEKKEKSLTGYSRSESPQTEFFVVKNIKGSISDNSLKIKEEIVLKKKSANFQRWCRFEGKLTYDSITGYLKGTFESYDCQNVYENVILYKTTESYSNHEDIPQSHIWFENFIKEFKKGFKAPLIRKKERDSFVFEPIYFDFDLAVIREEHKAFLIKMAKVVEGHSDLRIQVTGHTDSDGSDGYNDGLSKRRAKAIVDFFESIGLDKDRLEFDYKGEKDPVDTNKTPEGKQHNRRVDFIFI